VTEALAPLFSSVQTIEPARSMARRLERRGFACWRLDAGSARLPEGGFDVVTCLNVIDRCHTPRALLERLSGARDPEGLLVIATPLPLSAFVYDGGTTREPRERLECRSDDWESAAGELAENELARLGLSVRSLSRAPYVSRGFAGKPVWLLDDAIFVCSRS
jgi:SAM-dependent methyltransferase